MDEVDQLHKDKKVFLARAMNAEAEHEGRMIALQDTLWNEGLRPATNYSTQDLNKHLLALIGMLRDIILDPGSFASYATVPSATPVAAAASAAAAAVSSKKKPRPE